MLDLLTRANPLPALGIVVATDASTTVSEIATLAVASIGKLVVEIFALLVAWLVGIERGRHGDKRGKSR